MNKLLATSALVAAGLVASAGVASAQAPAPIQVVVGGFAQQVFGTASNNDGVNYASGNGRGASGVVSRPNRTSQNSDVEVFVGGRSTLANGIVVGFDVQIEGNSNNYAGANTAIGNVQDNIDESYIFIDGGFGRVLLGSENEAPYIMHVGAPAPGATGGSGYASLETAATSWVQQPVNVSLLNTTSTAQNGDAQRLTYFTPRFSGLQAGVSYTPNSLEDANGFSDLRAARANGWSPGLNYTNTLGGIRIAASAGLAYYPALDAAASNTANGNAIKDWSAGLNLGFGDFTVGGAYRVVDAPLATTDGSAWSIGAAYQSGPIAIHISYLQSTVNGTATVGDDVFKIGHLTGAYTMGPGVDLIGSIFTLSYKDEAGAAANNNSGSGGVVGIRLTF